MYISLFLFNSTINCELQVVHISIDRIVLDLRIHRVSRYCWPTDVRKYGLKRRDCSHLAEPILVYLFD